MTATSLRAATLRHQLLAKLLTEGDQPIPEAVALANYFPDISISSWCMRHGLTCTTDHFKRGVSSTWTFLTFSKINDAEL